MTKPPTPSTPPGAALAVETVSSAIDVGRADWERLGDPASPFLNADFLAIAERHGAAGPASGWQACHRVARDRDGTVVGILPTYLKAHSHGDFVRDWSWAQAYEQAGGRYYPRLMSGVPHTPATGPRLLVPHDGDGRAAAHALVGAVLSWVRASGVSSWHVALPAAADAELLRSHGLLESHDVQFHWRDRGYGDFDGYLAAFSAEKRRKVRAERRRVAESGLAIETLHGDEVDAREWPVLHALYGATFDRFGNYAAFPAECFAELARALGRRMVLFVARDGRAPVAVSILYRGADTLYGRYWGAADAPPGLHFELCFYRGIEYCLREGLATFEPGAGGEHKVARGFEPRIVRSLHWIEDAGFRAVVARHLARQRDAVAAYADEAATHLPFRKG